MDFQNFLNLTNLSKEVSIWEVVAVAMNSGVAFAFDDEGKPMLDFTDFLSGDQYNFWIHLFPLLPSLLWEVDPTMLSRS